MNVVIRRITLFLSSKSNLIEISTTLEVKGKIYDNKLL